MLNYLAELERPGGRKAMLKFLGLFILVGGLWYGIGAAMTHDSKGAIIGVFIGVIGILITWKAEGKKK